MHVSVSTPRRRILVLSERSFKMKTFVKSIMLLLSLCVVHDSVNYKLLNVRHEQLLFYGYGF
mgnify:CR=1 FL=1